MDAFFRKQVFIFNPSIERRSFCSPHEAQLGTGEGVFKTEGTIFKTQTNKQV
jgi:hypothetical protein